MIEYRLATINDNQQLMELTASTVMTGEVGLRIDRNPDFFELIKLRGKSKVFIAEENQNIISSLCVSLQNVYL